MKNNRGEIIVFHPEYLDLDEAIDILTEQLDDLDTLEATPETLERRKAVNSQLESLLEVVIP
jgi:hypothetical protein